MKLAWQARFVRYYYNGEAHASARLLLGTWAGSRSLNRDFAALMSGS